MQRRSSLSLLTIFMLVLGVAMSGVAAPAPPAITPITTSLMLPIPPDSFVTVIAPDGPPIDVLLSGNVHVLSHVAPGVSGTLADGTLDVHINLAGITGQGTDGNIYLGRGTFWLSEMFTPGPPPIGPSPGSLAFTLMLVGNPEGQLSRPPAFPLPLQVLLTFDSETGEVTGASALRPAEIP